MYIRKYKIDISGNKFDDYYLILLQWTFNAGAT